MISNEIQQFSDIDNPTPEDYEKLLQFTRDIIQLFRKERKARSSVNKKRNTLANRVRELEQKKYP